MYAFHVLSLMAQQSNNLELVMSDNAVRQMKRLLTVICGRKPDFGRIVRGAVPNLTISWALKAKKKAQTITGKGRTSKACVRSFYGNLLALFAKWPNSYINIARQIYRKCKNTDVTF